jgi:hypothetical protein
MGSLHSESGQAPRYVVQIRRHGVKAFGWFIYRDIDAVEVQRSARLFPTRIEALLDSARAAATLNIAVIEASSVEGENRNDCD